MNFSETDINPTRKSLSVAISLDEIKSEKNKLIQEFKNKAKVKGFRPGKAPQSIVVQQFKKEIEEELKRKLATNAYKHAKENSKINIYGIVEVQDEDLKTDQDASITFVADIVPEFELPNYEGIDVKAPMIEITQEDIDKVITQIQEQRASFDIVERAAEKGDYVKLGYEGKIGDKLIAEILPNKTIYGTQKTTWEEAGAEDGHGIKAVIEGVIGMKKGDTKEVTMDFPADFKESELAGKSATYTLEVQEVRAKTLPEINEEFLKSIQEESMDSLKANIEKEIKRSRDTQSLMRKRDQVMQFLEDNTQLEVPETSVNGKVRNILQHKIHIELQKGTPQSELESQKDELFKQAEEDARKAAKAQFIVEKISEKEKIKVSREDLNAMVIREAYASRMDPKQFSKELQKSPERLQALHDHALFDKTLDFLVEKANVILIDEAELTKK